MTAIPADYLEVYDLLDGQRRPIDIEVLTSIPAHVVRYRLEKLKRAGYVRQDENGIFVQDKPFDVMEVNRLLTRGGM